MRKRARIRSKLLHNDPTRKRFWRMLKNQVKVAGNITAATNDEGNMVFEQHEIEEVVLSHFSDMFQASYTKVKDTPTTENQVQESIDELDAMIGDKRPMGNVPPNRFESIVCSHYTLSELTEILRNIPNGKASGYDAVPNELLKNTGDQFKNYLLVFLNRIMDDGIVPEELNKGKCMLIHKVRKYEEFVTIIYKVSLSTGLLLYESD